MRIVADENIPYVDEFFAALGEVVKVAGRTLSKDQLTEADVLLVRSVTQVNESLLAGTPVKFVASATIGTDHIDKDWLAAAGIAFANAPGCNAESVVDYVLSALFNLEAETGVSLNDRVMGIVGVGSVGGRLYQRLSALGYQVLMNDPPREAAGEQGDGPWTSLNEVVARCDVICLHTPMTTAGAFPSYHLFDEARLNSLRSGCWLINAGRGAVVDNKALNHLLQQRQDIKAVLDVWEDEPGISPALAQQVYWGTPHIAGYSLEGRARGTESVYQSLCEYLGVPARCNLESLLPPPQVVSVELGPSVAGRLRAVDLINLCYDLRKDHYTLAWVMAKHGAVVKDGLVDDGAEARRLGFDRLRREYPARREFSSLKVAAADSALCHQLAAIGFTLVDS